MKIDIVGGGIAGCASALELANQGHKIRLRESRAELLAGSSNATPCRLTLGFHYFDKETALKCLKSTIAFVRRYPGFKIIDSQKEATHLKNGWYFIAKGSFHEAEKVLAFYQEIQAEYRALVKEDPCNEVFGSPEEFIRILGVDEYRNHIDPEKVEMGIETAECTLDFPRFREMFIQKVMSHSNIEVYFNQEIIEIKQAKSHNGFSLLIKENEVNNLWTVETDFVINASWENIELLNQKAGFAMLPESRTLRTKCMVEVKIPDSLVSAHSTFVCFGPFCSFTNLGVMSGGGYSRGFITSELQTNVEKTTELELSERSKRLLHGGATEEEKVGFSSEIIKGISYYIPQMAHSEPLSIRFGIVKSPGEVDIFSPQSGSNQRRESGVSEQQFGWVSNASMKLLYGLQNAEAVCDLVARHEKALSNINEISAQAKACFEPEGVKTMMHLFAKHLQRYPDYFKDNICDETKISDFKCQLKDNMALKRSCLAELKKVAHFST